MSVDDEGGGLVDDGVVALISVQHVPGCICKRDVQASSKEYRAAGVDLGPMSDTKHDIGHHM